MKNTAFLTLAGLGVLSASLPGAYWLQQTVSPPYHLAATDKRAAPIPLSYTDLTGHSTYLLEERKVVLRWFRTFPDGETMLTNQEEAVPFWPTETCRLGVNRLCVGGLKVKGQTVVQVWQVSNSEQFQNSTVDPNTGLTVYPPTVVPVVDKSNVYEDNLQGKRLVRTMFENLGKANAIFIQFDDSRHLYELDTSSGSMTKVLSASTDPSVEEQPALSNNYEDRFSGDNSGLGYVYLLITKGNGVQQSALLIRDSNRDGTLDPGSSMVISADDWVSLGLDSGYN